MTENIIDFLLECPALCGKKINVNYLDGESSSYSVESIPCDPVLRRYADGGLLCRKRFVLAMRKGCSLSAKRNLDVMRECEKICEWLREQERIGNVPCCKENGVSVSLHLIKDFGVVQTASTDMRYEAVLEYVFLIGN